jgi:hypothetical protein
MVGWEMGTNISRQPAQLKTKFLSFKAISHQGEGHMSFIPYLITANRGGISGGSPQVDAAAGFLSWKEMISSLGKHLQ